MKLHEIQPALGHREVEKRKGRGHGSGNGKTAGRGQKGQWSRSGGGVRPGFEGGQMPLFMRLPKRGFKNHFRVEFAEVNVGALNIFPAGSEVTPAALVEAGLVRANMSKNVKIMGKGELDRDLKVSAHKFTASAKEKIEAAKGSAEVI
ncbi:MAG: 50S ribosomal protein L15 [Eubacteriales bacterium]|nr:50S ribosomal protein L15 [Eubacteriales bacterium]